jgi:glyoxylase I family protein
MPLQRVSHIGICVSDLEQSLHFYRDVLGFQTLSKLDAAGEAVDRLLSLEGTDLHAVYLERDGTRLELLHFASPGHDGAAGPRPMNALGFTHLSLRVDDLAATLQALRDAGVRVLDETFIDNPDFDSAAVFVLDPDGTRVELVQSPGDPSATPGA